MATTLPETQVCQTTFDLKFKLQLEKILFWKHEVFADNDECLSKSVLLVLKNTSILSSEELSDISISHCQLGKCSETARKK